MEVNWPASQMVPGVCNFVLLSVCALCWELVEAASFISIEAELPQSLGNLANPSSQKCPILTSTSTACICPHVCERAHTYTHNFLQQYYNLETKKRYHMIEKSPLRWQVIRSCNCFTVSEGMTLKKWAVFQVNEWFHVLCAMTQIPNPMSFLLGHSKATR